MVDLVEIMAIVGAILLMLLRVHLSKKLLRSRKMSLIWFVASGFAIVTLFKYNEQKIWDNTFLSNSETTLTRGPLMIPKQISQSSENLEKQPLSWDTKSKNSSAAVLRHNPRVILAKQIESILHFPSESMVQVHLKAGARCYRPYLRGRLSGPALVILDWVWSKDEIRNTTIVSGFYRVPVGGQYFLEIIVVFCENIFPSVQSGGDLSLLEHDVQTNFDFSKVCIESSRKHRLTEKDAKIEIDPAVVDSRRESGGYWRYSGNPTLPTPILTRAHVIFSKARENKIHWPNDYSLEWSNSLKDLTVQKLRQKTPISICNIGWSHSRELTNSMQAIGLNLGQYNVNVSWGGAKYPEDVTVGFAKGLIERFQCQKMVIAVGQWPASFSRGKPMLLGDYYKEMLRVFTNLRENLPSHVHLFARSIHHVPLGDKISMCSPKDWRTPAVIDGYNAVLKRIIEKVHGIQFIDTLFLTNPMWDSAADWAHLIEKVALKEALYIAAVALGIVDPDRRFLFRT